MTTIRECEDCCNLFPGLLCGPGCTNQSCIACGGWHSSEEALDKCLEQIPSPDDEPEQEIPTVKVVINTTFGGFEIPPSLEEHFFNIYLDKWEAVGSIRTRTDPALISFVESPDYSGPLAVVEIPSDVDWTIEEYDGKEHVAEVHRRWFSFSGKTHEIGFATKQRRV